MKRLVPFAAIFEMATGLALLVAPSLLARLLLGVDITGAAVVIARLTGVALLSMGFGWWPGPWLASLLGYNSLASLYLLSLGIRGDWVGPLLWPAVVVHAVLTLLVARMLVRRGKAARGTAHNG